MTRTEATIGSTAFFFLAPGTVAGLGPWWISGWRMQPAFLDIEALRYVGVALIVLGLVISVECILRFAWKGRGTPAPFAPPERLVVSGLYRHVRNPMYVAVLGVILGLALLQGSTALLIYGAVTWAAFHVFVLGYEEPTLRSMHPDDYAAFTAGVPRWIPRLTPWRG